MRALTTHEQLLITKALDGDLSGAEKEEFTRLIQQNPTARQEWESMKEVKAMTGTMKFPPPPEETWDRYWAGVYARMERGLAWLLASAGAAVIIALGGYHAVMKLLEDTSVTLPMKMGVVALLLGTAILIVSVAREKWFTRKADKYREIIR